MGDDGKRKEAMELLNVLDEILIATEYDRSTQLASLAYLFAIKCMSASVTIDTAKKYLEDVFVTVKDANIRYQMTKTNAN